jgi:nitrous oxidase accessory protein NosD
MHRKFTFFLILLASVALLSQNLFAGNLTVGLCAGPGTHYFKIQTAVNMATPGAVVKVCPGIYAEQITINKSLTLLGIKNGTMDAPTIVSPDAGVTAQTTDLSGFPTAAQIFVDTASDVTISHLTIDGSNSQLSGCGTNLVGIYFKNSSGTISSNALRNQILDPADQGCQDGLAINVESAGTSSIAITGNSVRNYDKNGITVSGIGGVAGPQASVTSNTVIGLGATLATPQNGIQIAFGASGTVSGNKVADNIFTNPPCGGGTPEPPCFGSSGILIYASAGVKVSGNTVTSTQFGIVPASDPSLGTANGTTITGNHVAGTQSGDGIDLCSDNNTVKSNTVHGSGQSGIHIDDRCLPSTGSGNTVTGNSINDACAGILLGTGSTNTSTPNILSNVSYTTLAGDVCPAKSKQPALQPSPYQRK